MKSTASEPGLRRFKTENSGYVYFFNQTGTKLLATKNIKAKKEYHCLIVLLSDYILGVQKKLAYLDE